MLKQSYTWISARTDSLIMDYRIISKVPGQLQMFWYELKPVYEVSVYFLLEMDTMQFKSPIR